MISQDMEKITKQEVDDFKRLYDKFDSLTDEVIKYIKEKRYEKYLTGMDRIEDYGYLSVYEKTFDIMLESFEYQDHYGISIPWEHVYTDTWKEYLDDQVKEDIEKEKARKEKELKIIEEREIEQLKRLLGKYGKKI